jgi:hypothetical protein
MSTILLSILLGSLINRFRGGWPDKPSWMPGHTRLWAALFAFIALYFVSGPLIASIIASLYLLGSVWGWASYMNCGGNPHTWSDNPVVDWIDSTLLSLYGPEWYPTGGKADPVMLASGYVVESPTGEIRPFSWRRKRECTGMALRGLMYLPMFLVIPVLMHSWIALPVALGLVLFAPIYGIARVIYNKTDKRVKYRDDSLTIAEPLTGALFGFMIILQWILAV